MNSMGGLGSHEWRGGYPVHERAERAEDALKKIREVVLDSNVGWLNRNTILEIIKTVLEK